MSKIVTRQKRVGFLGSVLWFPVRVDRNTAVKEVVDDILKENTDLEAKWMEDGSVELLKNGEEVGTVTEEN